MNPVQQALASLQNGVKGFQNPPAPSGNVVSQALDQVPVLKNIRGFNQGVFGQQAVNNPQLMVGGEADMGETPGYKIPMHPDDINEGLQAINRRVFNSNDIKYAVNQMPDDEKTIMNLAKRYIGKAVTRLDMNNISQELLNRIRVDQNQPQIALPQ